MNDDQIKGAWKQIEGEARLQWGKLTDDDWQVAQGDIEKLSGRIQVRYGDAKDIVAKKLNEIVARIRENVHTPKQADEAPSK